MLYRTKGRKLENEKEYSDKSSSSGSILCSVVISGGLRKQLFCGVNGIVGIILCRNGSDIVNSSGCFHGKKYSRILGGGSGVFREQSCGRHRV